MEAQEIIRRLGAGRTMDEFAAAVRATAEAVVETGNNGTVTLKVTLKNSAKEKGSRWLILEAAVSRTMPGPSAKGAAFYSFEGDLHRDDPRQPRLPMRVVDEDTGEIREMETRGKVERTVG